MELTLNFQHGSLQMAAIAYWVLQNNFRLRQISGALALFYRDFEYSRGLIKIAKMDSVTKAFDVSGPLDVTIELIDQDQR